MSDEDTLFTVESIAPTYTDWKKVPLAEIQKVFDYWVTTVKSGRGPKPRLDETRKRCIAKAIMMYDVDTCMDAVRGCTLSDWHMGGNPQGKRYDDITLILRNADKIEKFAGLAQNEKSGWEFE